MATIKNILCPIDFSECSHQALDYAIDLAKTLGANMRLLHVYQDPISSIPFAIGGTAGLPTAPIELIVEARKQRDAEIARMQQVCRDRGISTEVEEIEGAPALTIVMAAEDHKVDLIVMGTHGRTGIAHAMVGSIAERVVRLSPCPVLTVRGTRN
jgi:nucleotide-binding universal stress UspA family protein